VKSLQCCHDKTISIDDLIAMGMFVLAITVERHNPRVRTVRKRNQQKYPKSVINTGTVFFVMTAQKN
jgi:hypothetical protein